jgi:hypothetical protein
MTIETGCLYGRYLRTLGGGPVDLPQQGRLLRRPGRPEGQHPPPVRQRRRDQWRGRHPADPAPRHMTCRTRRWADPCSRSCAPRCSHRHRPRACCPRHSRCQGGREPVCLRDPKGLTVDRPGLRAASGAPAGRGQRRLTHPMILPRPGCAAGCGGTRTVTMSRMSTDEALALPVTVDRMMDSELQPITLILTSTSR